MKIKKLSDEAVSKLQTGIVITDAVQCVLELVHNSLDAEATAIAVRVDMKHFKIQVIDNGKGIQKDDLELVGERFMTSKHHSLDNRNSSPFTYGFKGQAISCLLDVCKTLTIKTKSERDGPVLAKVFENSEALPISENETEELEIGTTVIIEEFMFNMPVRRKRICEVFDMEEIKKQLQYLAVIHYKVYFTLRNENKNLILFKKQPAESILQSVSQTFGKTIVKHLKPVSYEDQNFEITGFLSLKPQKQNNMQLIYINKRIITKGVIHKFVNSLMKECFGSIVLLEESLLEKDLLLKKLKNTAHNVFIVLVKCPHNFYELFTNSRKTTVEFKNWKEAFKCVSKAVKKTFKIDGKNLEELPKVDDFQEIEPIQETKAKFGTSLLINAIRGAPVKRALKRRNSSKKRKKKENEDETKLEFSLLASENIKEKSLSIKSTVNTTKIDLVNCTHDSLESPIPKNQLKPALSMERNTSLEPKQFVQKNLNNSFVEFYKWLRIKFESETSAFNLYNEFLQLKEKKFHQMENDITFNQSPVLGGKVSKAFHASKLKNRRFVPFGHPNLDKKMVNYKSKRNYNDFSNTHKRFQILREETTETHTLVPVNKNLNPEFEYYESLKKPNFKELYEPSYKQKNINYQDNLRVTHKSHKYQRAVSSPASSEVIFTNLIKFRNLSESFIRRASQSRRVSENTHHQSNMNTWVSHYQNQTVANLTLNENVTLHERGNCLVDIDNYRNNNFGKFKSQDNFVDLSGREPEMFSFKHYKKNRAQFCNAEIQTNISSAPHSLQMISVMVQTDKNDACSKILESEVVATVPETPSFEIFNQNASNQETDGNLEISCENIRNEENHFISQEVPNPDFWNFPTPKNVDAETNVTICFESEKIKNSKINEKGTSSSELVCGQKSSTTNAPLIQSSSSKETQTLAKMYTECLKEIGNSEDLTAGTIVESNNQLRETIPIGRVEENVPEQSNFLVTERHDFLPKGLSPPYVESKTPQALILNSEDKNRINSVINNTGTDLLASIKWQDEATDSLTKPLIPEEILHEMNQKAECNLIYHKNEILSASLSYCAIKIHNLLHSFAFTKELLSDVEILGQLDKKFIVAKIEVSIPKKMSLISLFDQHAVDERIRLEKLMQIYITSDGKLLSSQLNHSIECSLSESLIQDIQNFHNRFLEFGLNYKILNETTILISEIPALLMDKHEKNLKNSKDDTLKNTLQELISNIIDEIKETRGTVPKVPKVIHDSLCMEACRKAIKFNQMLTIETMEEMINKLKNCKLPFQCAHGRPSVIPIIDLEDFNSMTVENNGDEIEKIKKFYQEKNMDVIQNSNTAK